MYSTVHVYLHLHEHVIPSVHACTPLPCLYCIFCILHILKARLPFNRFHKLLSPFVSM
jgi:hypothetical protein